jgi:hypothetical protein
MGFSPNKEHVMMSSLKDTDKKILRAKARRLLTGLSDPGHPGL